MNDKIRELVKQSGGRFSTHTLTSYPAQHRESIELWDKNIEKFAELIIKECVTTLEFHGYDEAVPYVKWMATNKFGVKE